MFLIPNHIFFIESEYEEYSYYSDEEEENVEELAKDDVNQANIVEANIEKVKNKHLDVVQCEERRSRSPSIEVELQRLVKDVSDNVNENITYYDKYLYWFLFTLLIHYITIKEFTLLLEIKAILNYS